MRQLFVLLITFYLTPVFSQTGEKVEKAIETFNSGEIDDAIAMMGKITKSDPSDDNWNTLVTMYYQRYEYAKENFANSFSAAVKSNMGIKTKYKPYTSESICFDDFISKCKEASLYSQSTKASMFLRSFFVDAVTDTSVTKEAYEEFKKAEEYFGQKDFVNSKSHYQKALTLQPDYYKAIIYLGDSYWHLNNLDSAIYFFRKGIEMYPNLLEPRKYLVDALGYSQKNEEAKKVCIEAICVYPDQSLYLKYSDLVKREKKKFNKNWVKRVCEINSFKRINIKTKDPIWSTYQKAGNEIKTYCDTNGIIIKQNSLTKSKYAEVYSWEKILNSSTQIPNELTFAKEMDKKGFLDCYVFISEFHFDLYKQYEDFIKHNKERVKIYIETYLVE